MSKEHLECESRFMQELPREIFVLHTVAYVECPTFKFSNVSIDDEFPSPVNSGTLSQTLNETTEFSPNGNSKAGILANRWQAPRIDWELESYVDFSMINHQFPIFSTRAVDDLKEILESSGELLPLFVHGHLFYFLHIHRFSDCLDLDRSTVTYWDESGVVMDIDEYPFHSEKLRDKHIFRVKEYPSRLMVSDYFLEQCRSSGLFGFYARKAWPLAPGEYWQGQDGCWFNSPNCESGKITEQGRNASNSIHMTVNDDPMIEQSIPTSYVKNLIPAAKEGAALCQCSFDDSKSMLAEGIDTMIWVLSHKLSVGEVSQDDAITFAVSLGALLGHIMVRDFGWSWCNLLTNEQAAPRLAVCSPDKRYAIFPMEYSNDCIADRIEPLVELALDMIDHNQLLDKAPGSFSNVFEQVNRLI